MDFEKLFIIFKVIRYTCKAKSIIDVKELRSLFGLPSFLGLEKSPQTFCRPK